MKNLSVILNVVLIIAVAILYFLHFSSDRPSQESQEEQIAALSGALPQIAYVNSDSLLSKYDYFKDKADELEQTRVKLEGEFSNRAKGLQSEFENFQRNAANMTIAQGQAKEEELRKKQQNLMQYQESLQQQLIREESKVNNELYEKVSDYLEDYGKKNNFQIVLTYTKGSGVLYANDSLNITNQVVEGLNREYNAAGAGKDNGADTTKTE